MDLNEAIEKARYILKEEEKNPTVDYRYDSDEWPAELTWDMALRDQYAENGRLAGPSALSRMRVRKSEGGLRTAESVAIPERKLRTAFGAVQAVAAFVQGAIRLRTAERLFRSICAFER